jgi:hypothetical protein
MNWSNRDVWRRDQDPVLACGGDLYPIGLGIWPWWCVASMNAIEVIGTWWTRITRWSGREGGRGLIANAKHRAEALQDARRLRFKANVIRKNRGNRVELEVTAAFLEVSTMESKRRWEAECEELAQVYEAAAQVLEDGVGGVEPFLRQRTVGEDVSLDLPDDSGPATTRNRD